MWMCVNPVYPVYQYMKIWICLNAKECQHQNNVAGGLGRGPGPLGPQGPGLGPGSWRQEGVFFVLLIVFFVFFSCVFTGSPPPGLDFPNPPQKNLGYCLNSFHNGSAVKGEAS